MPKKGCTREEDKERMLLLGKLIHKYLGAEPRLAMKELFQIDFIRKNFSKVSVYNYFLNMRRMIKQGIPKPKGMPTNLVNTVLRLAGKEPIVEQVKSEATSKPVKETLQDKIDKLIKEGESLNEKYGVASAKLGKELEEVKRKQEALQKAYMLEADRIGNSLNELYTQQAKELLQ